MLIDNWPCPCGSTKPFVSCCRRKKPVAHTLNSLANTLVIANQQAKANATDTWNSNRQGVYDFISDTVYGLNTKEYTKVAILGAGNCEDLPLAFLAEHAARIDLYDVDWLAINAAKSALPGKLQKKLHCYCADITGLYTTLIPELQTFLESGQMEEAFLLLQRFYRNPKNKFSINRKYDLVLSVNIVSQLFSVFFDLLMKTLIQMRRIENSPIVAEFMALINNIADEIVPEQHLRILHSLTSPKGKSIITVDKFHWGSFDGIKSPITDLISEPEDMLKQDIHQMLQAKGHHVQGSAIDTLYEKYFSLQKRDQWLWRFHDDRVFLVDGFILKP